MFLRLRNNYHPCTKELVHSHYGNITDACTISCSWIMHMLMFILSMLYYVMLFKIVDDSCSQNW